MTNASNPVYTQIAEALRQHETFVVFSHMRPDGDALGCTLAMALCLQQMGKKVTAWNEDGPIEKFSYLPGIELVTKPPATPQSFDVAIVLDNAVRERAGASVPAVASAKVWINIDHHITNAGYGDIVLIDGTAPATGQILYDFFRAENLPITSAMADNLFVAISTDTGSFQYPATTARTYEIAADLIRAGVDVGELSRKTYDSHPRRRIELLRETLNRLEFHGDGEIALTALTQEAITKAGALPDDTEGLIDHIRAVEGVRVAALMEEMPDDKVRISLRSKDKRIDVSTVCKLFGGGGHALAAGARTRGPIDAVKTKLVSALSDALSH